MLVILMNLWNMQGSHPGTVTRGIRAIYIQQTVTNMSNISTSNGDFVSNTLYVKEQGQNR